MTEPADTLASALEALASQDFATGQAWHAAHELTQAHEGEAAYDWLHALLHRIEGDHANAGYWYRRAGRRVFSGSFEEEARALRDSLA